MTKKHISIIPLGCPKNDVDSELIAGALKKSGYNIEWDNIAGDTVIINTCGFIKDAIDESLDVIMQSIQAKKEGRIRKIVVTGCLPQRFGKELSSRLKDVDLFLGVNGLEDLPGLIKQDTKSGSLVGHAFTSYPEHAERLAYQRTHSVYLKIADGCNNNCSYCVIPFIKGRLKSRKTDDIINEAKALVDKGAVELNIIAQDTLNFGVDRGENGLIRLLSALEKIHDLKWIRLNYLYPSNITDEFLTFIKDSAKVVKYFDMPIQHISDRILKLMNRKTTSDTIKRVIDKIGENIKEPFFRTTVITGFPGETEKDFNELLDFFNAYSFHRIGVFPYSKEEPAAASMLKDQIPQHIITERVNRINDLANKIMNDVSADFIGRTYEALIEGPDPSDPTITLVRPWFFAPEIDGYVLIYPVTPERPDSQPIAGRHNKIRSSESPTLLARRNAADNHTKGQFANIRIIDALGVDLVGEFTG